MAINRINFQLGKGKTPDEVFLEQTLRKASGKRKEIDVIREEYRKEQAEIRKNMAEETSGWDINEEQLVSSDFNHNPHSAIVDLSLTKIIGAKMAKVSAWYDNEWGFACRMCDLANYIGKI